MKTNLKSHSLRYQMPIFITGMILFTAAACFGWIKLQYGFNFIDEGYHATESWRLAVGDHFLDDKITGALMHYTLINRLIFEICPDITLLGFRKIQFVLTIFALLLFGLALFKVSGRYAELPFIFSVFAFTGLDPIGMISNLYYQTYPHLFVTLHLSFLLFGLHAQKPATKKILYLLSGFCLWGMSLASLYTSVIILSPLLLFFLSRKFNFIHYEFTFKNLTYVLAPFIFSWAIFIVIYNKPYVMNIFSSIEVMLSMPSHSTGLIGLNWELIKYVSIAGVLLAIFFLILQLRNIIIVLIAGAALSLMIFFIIKTSFWGSLAPYYNGLFGRPMWFSSLLIAFVLFFWIYIFFKYCLKSVYGKEEELSIILMVPFTICALTMSIFSSLGSLAVCQTAIPAVAGIFYVVTSRLKTIKYPQTITLAMVLLLLSPFYYMVSENDWEFTFFDVVPSQADTRIKTGFGRGIYANRLYAKLYDWLIANAAALTQPGDYEISYAVAPMVHMITGLRPSLDDTFIILTKSRDYYEKCIEKMEQRGREPKIAFIFERMPGIFPVSMEKGTVRFFGKSFDFFTSQDPISVYVRTHMTPASTFKISDDNVIRCYVNQKLKHNPEKSGKSLIP